MTKLEKLYSIIERSTLVALSCKELSRSGSKIKQGCSPASGGTGGEHHQGGDTAGLGQVSSSPGHINTALHLVWTVEIIDK